MGRGGGRGWGRGSGRRGGGMSVTGRGIGMAGRRGFVLKDAADAFFTPRKPIMKKSMTAQIDQDLCNGCGICFGMCPRGAISMRGGKALVDQKACTGCGICENECPLGAAHLT